MGWFVAFVALMMFATFAGGSLLHPVLYGLFIACIVVVPIWLLTSIGGGLIDWILGKRR